jgi:ATP-dependent Lhr-like helicase
VGRSATSVVADLGFSLRIRGDLSDVAELMRALLRDAAFAADLDGALADSPALRERFTQVAQTGLMLLRNPERRRRVGGRDWGSRRLFDQVRDRDADFVLLRQALREVRAELCDAAAALAFAAELPRRSVRCRWLSRPSPFAEAWTQEGTGPAQTAESPAEALRRLHARLMGDGHAAG